MYSEAEISNSAYGYVPNLPANAAALAIFTLVLAAQVVLGLYFRQWWFFVTWASGSVLEVLGYVARVYNHFYLTNAEMFKMQICSTVIAPAFHMAGIYYLLAKIVTIYGRKYSPLKPMTYSAIFIVVDVFSIIVQSGGGGLAAAGSSSGKRKYIDIGNHVMVAGIALQVFAMTIFIGLLAYVLFSIYRDDSIHYNQRYVHIRDRKAFKPFLYALCVTILFIYIRSAYRIAELSEGWSGYLVRHEIWFLVFDGLMMAIATVCLSIFHPGFALGKGVIAVEGLHYKRNGTEPESVDDEIESQPSSGSAFEKSKYKEQF